MSDTIQSSQDPQPTPCIATFSSLPVRPPEERSRARFSHQEGQQHDDPHEPADQARHRPPAHHHPHHRGPRHPPHAPRPPRPTRPRARMRRRRRRTRRLPIPPARAPVIRANAQAREQSGRIGIDDDPVVDERGVVQHGTVLVVGARGQIEDVARGLGIRGRDLVRARREHVAGGTVVGVGAVLRVRGPRGDVEAEDGPLEDLVGCFGLVGGHFVARLEDAREGVVAVLPHLSARVAAVDHDVGVAGGAERGALAVVYGEGGAFAADPWGYGVRGRGVLGGGGGKRTVTGVISVSEYQGNFDAFIEKVGHVG